MKKNNKIIAFVMMICMMVTSCVLLFVSLYASNVAANQDSQGAIVGIEQPIVYNYSTNEFQVYDYDGISWIGSNAYVTAYGSPSTSQPQGGVPYKQATPTATYKIMNNITYTAAASDKDNDNFEGIILENGGSLDGQNHTLTNFPVLNNLVATSALAKSNGGIIQNVNMENINLGAVIQTSLGLICANNNGTINNCTVSGSYASANFDKLFGIATANSGTISNCTNNATLNNSKAGGVAAGIAEALAGSEFTGNTNSADVTANYMAAGIGFAGSDVAFATSGNTNENIITSVNIAAGIVVSDFELSTLTINTIDENNGSMNSASEYKLYYENAPLPSALPFGIRWSVNKQAFEIYDAAGVSYISSSITFNSAGEKSSNGYHDEAASNSHYKIMNDIVYDEFTGIDGKFNTAFKTNAPNLTGGTGDDGGKLDGTNPAGGGFTLSDFPLRQHGTQANYSALFLNVSGTVENVNIILLNMGEDIYTMEEGARAGVLASELGSDARIIGCSTAGDLNISVQGASSAYIGGIAGAITSIGGSNVSFEHCSNYLNITVHTINLEIYIGGLVGSSLQNGVELSINSSQNIGSLAFQTFAINTFIGGMVGRHNGPLRILNSLSEGDLTNGRNIGGFLAHLVLRSTVSAYMVIDGCSSIGVIRNPSYGVVGGLVATVIIPGAVPLYGDDFVVQNCNIENTVWIPIVTWTGHLFGGVDTHSDYGNLFISKGNLAMTLNSQLLNESKWSGILSGPTTFEIV